MQMLDESVLEDLDFDHSTRCEVVSKIGKDCGRRHKADYLIVLACCSANRYFCQKCLEHKLSQEFLFGHGECGNQTIWAPPIKAYKDIIKL